MTYLDKPQSIGVDDNTHLLHVLGQLKGNLGTALHVVIPSQARTNDQYMQARHDALEGGPDVLSRLLRVEDGVDDQIRGAELLSGLAIISKRVQHTRS